MKNNRLLNIAICFCFKCPGCILCSPPPPQSGNNPALFVLEKAEPALCAELPELQPAPAGNCATGYCLLAFFLQPSEGRAEQSVYRSACCGDAHPHLLRLHRSVQPCRAKAHRSAGSCQNAGSAVKHGSSWKFALDTWNIIASLLVLPISLLELN